MKSLLATTTDRLDRPGAPNGDAPLPRTVDVGELVAVGDVREPRRADDIFTCGEAPNRCDFFGDLAAGQDAALAGLGTLAHLDLEHAHGIVRRLEVERARTAPGVLAVLTAAGAVVALVERAADRDLGVMTFDRTVCGIYDQETVTLAETYGQIVALAILYADQARLLARYRESLEEQHRLQTTAAGVDPGLVRHYHRDKATLFATTLAEHNRNVEKWQKQYWRERWAKERAAQGPG